MRLAYKFSIPLILALLPTFAHAQGPVAYIGNGGVGSTVWVSSANPLPVTGGGGGGSVTAAGMATVAAPTYVEGSQDPLSMNLTGDLRTIAKQSGTWTVGLTAGTSIASAPCTAVSSTALAANLVINNAASKLCSFEVQADSTLYAATWFVMIYNSTTAPADGAVTPIKCYQIPAQTVGFSAAFPIPVTFGAGVVIGVSTTGCFTKTASTHAAFISGDFQ